MVDVVIVGGGICGCSLLYELSRYDVQAVLLEKENDVSVGTTKANSAIVHAGYDPAPRHENGALQRRGQRPRQGAVRKAGRALSADRQSRARL